MNTAYITGYGMKDIIEALNITTPTVTSVVLLGLILYLILKNVVKQGFDKMKSQEIEKYKNELQLIYLKNSVVLDKQKESYHKIIKTMNETIKVVDILREEPEQLWPSLIEEKRATIQNMIIEETVFLSKDIENALWLFCSFIEEAMNSKVDPAGIKYNHETMMAAFHNANFISGCIRDQLRKEMGLQIEKQPLWDVFLIGSYMLLRSGQFKEYGYEIPGELIVDKTIHGEELFQSIKGKQKNIGLELQRIKKSIFEKMKDEHCADISDINKYIDLLCKYSVDDQQHCQWFSKIKNIWH